MVNTERKGEDEIDPFTFFAEKQHIDDLLKSGVKDYDSKMREALLAVTVYNGNPTKKGRKEFRRIEKEAAQLYRNNLKLIARAHEMINNVLGDDTTS